MLRVDVAAVDQILCSLTPSSAVTKKAKRLTRTPRVWKLGHWSPLPATVFASADGQNWQARDIKTPRQIRRIGSWLHGYGWPPSKFSRSRDGATWELVPNPQEWHGKAFALCPLSGGAPPKLPANARASE